LTRIQALSKLQAAGKTQSRIEGFMDEVGDGAASLLHIQALKTFKVFLRPYGNTGEAVPAGPITLLAKATESQVQVEIILRGRVKAVRATESSVVGMKGAINNGNC
jgi:hypothetical protein